MEAASAPAGGGGGASNAAPAAAPAAASSGDNKSFLEKVELFKRLPPDELPNLAKACQEVSFEPGAKIINQGDEGNEFFVIKAGTAKVEVNGNMVATLKSGDYFGENALLRDDPRNATIICQAAITALKITRDNFVKLGLNEKLEFAKRGAVGGGAAADAEIKPPSQKSAADIKQISDALKGNANLNNMITLDEAKTKAMIDLMCKENVAKGTKIITEGDLNADYFYVVNKGTFEVSKVADASSAEKHVGRSQSLATLEAGKSFGELALLYFAPRAATITAVTDAEVFVIARQQFKDIITQSQADAASTYVKYLDKVKLLDALKDTEKK